MASTQTRSQTQTGVPFRLEVVSAIIEDGSGLVLIAERPAGKKLAGQWEFPGGKVEPGETPEEALVRELDEELSLPVSIVSQIGIFPHSYDWGEIELHVYIVKAKGLPRPSADVQKFRWLAAHEIDPWILVAADREPLRRYLNMKARPPAR